MSFGSPWLLLCLLAVPLAIVVYVLLDRRRSSSAAAWSRPALLPNMVGAGPGFRRYVPFGLFLLGLALLLVGFARPQAKVSQVKEGATVILALDISGSMAASDVHPTRLAAADASIGQLIQKLPDRYRASLVTFSDHVAVRVPPSYDRAALIRALPAKAQEEGTAIGDAVAVAVKVAQKAIGPIKAGSRRPPAAILLLSDGAQNTGRIDPKAAAALARKAAIPISTVSLGTPDGVVVNKIQGGTEQIRVPVDPSTLQGLARATGGRFYTAASATELTGVYKDLGSRLVKGKANREITSIAVGAALAAIVLGALLSGFWFRKLV
jgi:Ca-activated chloride channel family protein